MKPLYGAWRAALQRGATIAIVLICATTGARAAVLAPLPQKTILVLGDSLSAGYGLATGQGWVTLLARRIRATRPGWRVVNASISGETTAGGASRIGAEVARTRPSVVVIELGANDGLRGLPLAQTRINLEKIIRTAQSGGARVLLVGMRMPPNFGPAYTQAFAGNYQQLSHQYHTALLPFLLEPIMGARNAFQEDNLHPTAAVQPKLRDHVWTGLEPLLR